MPGSGYTVRFVIHGGNQIQCLGTYNASIRLPSVFVYFFHDGHHFRLGDPGAVVSCPGLPCNCGNTRAVYFSQRLCSCLMLEIFQPQENCVSIGLVL